MVAGERRETEVRGGKNLDAALIRFRWISPNEGLYGETQRVLVNGKRERWCM
jgi:hypothetical protein